MLTLLEEKFFTPVSISVPLSSYNPAISGASHLFNETLPLRMLSGSRTAGFESSLQHALAAVLPAIGSVSFSKSWLLNIQIRRNRLVPKISPSWDSL